MTANEIRDTIGENIRTIRERAGISQAELARRIGKTASSVSQYESGTISPRLSVIDKMCDALECHRSDLITYAVVGLTTSMEVTPEEENLLAAFRNLDADKQEQLIRVARTL